MNEPKPLIPFEPVPILTCQDGWTGERMATFLEVLGGTETVEHADARCARACRTVNIVNFRDAADRSIIHRANP